MHRVIVLSLIVCNALSPAQDYKTSYTADGTIRGKRFLCVKDWDVVSAIGKQILKYASGSLIKYTSNSFIRW